MKFAHRSPVRFGVHVGVGEGCAASGPAGTSDSVLSRNFVVPLSVSRAMFEAFVRLVRRVSSSTPCSGGPLEAIFAECGCLDKFLRVVAETPLLQLIEDANPCQEHGEPACLIETTCAGNGH
jgi:hypothetical protein